MAEQLPLFVIETLKRTQLVLDRQAEMAYDVPVVLHEIRKARTVKIVADLAAVCDIPLKRCTRAIRLLEDAGKIKRRRAGTRDSYLIPCDPDPLFRMELSRNARDK